MILYFILSVLVGLLKVLLYIVPSLPQVPQQIQDIGGFLITFLTGAFGFIVHIYTPALAGPIIGMVLALMFFNQGYYIVMFILRKLKLIG